MRDLWITRTHPDYNCDDIKPGRQVPVEEDVHRRHDVGIYSSTTQRRSEPAKAKMSSREHISNTVDNIYSQCATCEIVDPSSYSLTRVIRLGKNKRGSSVS